MNARLHDETPPDDTGPVVLRDEAPADIDAIDGLLRRAFATHPFSAHDEHRIVRRLRAAGQLTLGLVAVRADVEPAGAVVVGHAAVSPVTAGDAPGGWYGLGPVAVEPCRQRQGIGHRLVNEALARLRARGAAGCVVLGDPAWYGDFGFRPWPRLVLPDAPADHFLALPFLGFVPTGTVTYAPAFVEASAAGDTRPAALSEPPPAGHDAPPA